MDHHHNRRGSPVPDTSLSTGLGTLSLTPTSAVEEGDDALTEPPSLETQYQTEFFKVQGLVRSDTPETLMTEFTNRPDITIRCEQCGIYVDLVALQDHRAYHNALRLLKYKGDNFPSSTGALLKRRNFVVRQMVKQSTKPLEPRQVQVINDAFELIKANMEDTFEEFRAVRDAVDTKVQGLALSCSPKCVDAVGICSSSNERWKGSMEDTRVYQDCFGEDENKCYAALFDGHHGRFAAEVAADTLHYLLLNELAKFDSETKSTQILSEATEISGYEFNYPDKRDTGSIQQEKINIIQQIIDLCEDKYAKLNKSEDKSLPDREKKRKKGHEPKHPLQPKIAEAFKKVYEFLDILLSYGKDECSKVRWSGCSALTLLIHNTFKGDYSTISFDKGNNSVDDLVQLGLIHIANAGNVHAVLVRGNHGYQLTKDHTPSNQKEKKRIIQAGGRISESARECQVNGILSTTRGLGNHGDVGLKKCVCVEPHTLCVPIDQYAQFLVLASHGVWQVFSVQEVTSLLLKHFHKKKQLLPSHQIPPPDKMSVTLKPLFEVREESVARKRNESLFSSDVSLAGSSQSENRHSDRSDIKSESIKENASQKEDVNSSHSQEMLTIEADLKTEVGSRAGNDEDDNAQDTSRLSDDGEHISIPAHSDFSECRLETREEVQRELAKSMAEHLVQASLLAGSHDNITVMVMLFPGSGV